MTDHTPEPCGPACSEQHTYHGACALLCAELHGGVASPAWSVPCPKCGAPADRPCVREDGTAAAVECAKRWGAWERTRTPAAAPAPVTNPNQADGQKVTLTLHDDATSAAVRPLLNDLDRMRAAHEAHRLAVSEALGGSAVDWPEVIRRVRKAIEDRDGQAAEVRRLRAAHEEHRQQLAAALGGLDPATPWDGLIRRATQVLAGRHRAVDMAQEIEADRDRLAVQLANARAENDGLAECMRNTDRLATAEATELRHRAEKAEATVRDYENRITWETTCGEHARLLDACRAADERAEKAEATLTAVRRLAEPATQYDDVPQDRLARRILTALDGEQPAAARPPIAWCGASTPDLGVGTPMGPCVLRADHDGPVHQAASGAKWWPEQTLEVRDLTPPRRISTELAHEAAADGAGLYEALMEMFGGPLPPHKTAPLCWCGAQPFAGGVIHNPGCAWKNQRMPADPGPLREVAAQALGEEQTKPAVVDARPPISPGDFLPGYPTEADFDAAPPPQFTGVIAHIGVSPDQCRAEYHRPSSPSARCDLAAWHPDYHRDQTAPGGTFRWDDSVAMYPTTSPEDNR